MAGHYARQRFKNANPAAWEARMLVACRTCGAAPGVMCVLLDGSGQPAQIIHMARLEDAAKLTATR